MTDIRDLYPKRVEAASIASARGDRSEAERLYAEALVMGKEHFRADDPALAVPLNELSRLYVRRSEHARAEPLLQNLLGIRRASGEHHPDVATVLAGLAAVRRGLGDDAAAEDLYREALEIRERVHAPDHMAVVVTLEQLADTCAALRKFGEASALFERALTVRAKALGPDHPTVRTLRERLTELAVKASSTRPGSPLPLPEPPAATTPETLGVTNELVFLYEPEKPVRRASARRDRVMTPPFSAAVAAASLLTVPAHATAPARIPDPLRVAAPSLVGADSHEFDAGIVPRLHEPVAHGAVARHSQRIESPTRAEGFGDQPTNRDRRYGVAAGGVAVIASVLLLASSRHSGRTTSDPSPLVRASQPLELVRAAPAAPRAAEVVAPARLVAARPDSLRIASAKRVAAAPPPKTPQPDPQADKRSAVPDVPVLGSIGSLAIPNTNAPNVDSVMRASTPRRDNYTDQIGSAGRLATSVLSEDRSETSAKLIGFVPPPRFPDALRAQRIEGAVVVEFLVRADGSVDPSSMKVVRSPHALFTESVRNVLPRLRFQPARSADAKPHAEWVQYSVQFSATQ